MTPHQSLPVALPGMIFPVYLSSLQKAFISHIMPRTSCLYHYVDQVDFRHKCY